MFRQGSVISVNVVYPHVNTCCKGALACLYQEEGVTEIMFCHQTFGHNYTVFINGRLTVFCLFKFFTISYYHITKHYKICYLGKFQRFWFNGCKVMDHSYLSHLYGISQQSLTRLDFMFSPEFNCKRL